MTAPPPTLPLIIGPTASGKSAIAVEVAERLDAQHGIRAAIVTADSMQVYRGLDIGSAKPDADERRGIPHHLIDLVEPTEPFSVDAWLAAAEAMVDGLRRTGTVPLVVGGTHLYVKAFLEGLFAGPSPDPDLRRRLEAMDPDQRRAELDRVDPEAAARIHPNDVRRTVRALEVHRLTGRPITRWQAQWDRERVRPGCALFLLRWPTDLLNQRINERVRVMMDRGLLEETRALREAGGFGPQAAEALGYKQLIAHLRGEDPLDRAVERIKVETRRFAKNQRTWLRRLQVTPGSRWIDLPGSGSDDAAQVIVDQVVASM